MSHVPWIPLFTSWPRHRKTMRLRSILGTGEQILFLWTWAAENATNGDLSGFSVAEIEDAAGWKGEPGKAFKAMCDAGFIDVSSDVSNNTVMLHEWDETAGAKISAYLRRKEQQRLLMRARRSGSGSGDPDQKEEEREGRSKSNSNLLALTSPPASSVPTEPALMTFPCAGKVKSWSLTETIRGELAEAFPGVDVMACARKALEWCRANPKKVKTASRMRSWLGSVWCAGDQNRGQSQQAAGPLFNRPQQSNLRTGHVRAEDFKHDQVGEIKL